MQVFSDSDWAGCLRTRRSTSGGLVMVGWHPLRTWPSTQKVVATSSAELYSAAEGASRGLGWPSMLREMEVDASVEVSTDSWSATAFASTRGLGRMRHLEVKDFYSASLESASSQSRVPTGPRGAVDPSRVSCLCRALCGRWLKCITKSDCAFTQTDGRKPSKGFGLRGESLSGLKGRKACKNFFNGKCTDPSCACWHPPENQNYKSESGCRFGDYGLFRHSEAGGQPRKKSKKKWWKRISCLAEGD